MKKDGQLWMAIQIGCFPLLKRAFGTLFQQSTSLPVLSTHATRFQVHTTIFKSSLGGTVFLESFSALGYSAELASVQRPSSTFHLPLIKIKIFSP